MMCPTPAELARDDDARREHLRGDAIARVLRIAVWNQQMEAVVGVIRVADARGHGIIIDVSNTGNRIAALLEPLAAKGVAYVFDHDTGANYTRTIRLTEPKD